MSTPAFVKFSKINYSMEKILRKLQAEVLGSWNIVIESAGQLRASNLSFDGGLELVDDLLHPCVNELDALKMASKWEALGLVYKVPMVPCNIFLYFFNISPEGCACTLSFDSSLVFFESDDFSKGQFLTGFLTAITAALDVDVCGYGSDNAYEVKHETLDIDLVLERLKMGNLMTIKNPMFHAFSSRVIKSKEANALMENNPKNPNLRYSVSLKGYHIFSATP